MKITINYDGKWPSLCSGKLVVVIDGREWVFPDSPLESGGRAGVTKDYDDYCYKGLWKMREWPEHFPEILKEKVLEEINKTVPLGCCGGCT